MTRLPATPPLDPEPVVRPLHETLTDLAQRLGSLDDLAELSTDESLRVLQSWEHVLGAVTAAQSAALRALERRVRLDRGPHRGTLLLQEETADELALAVKVPSATAARRLGFAEGLGLLPYATLALREGRLGVPHAQVLVSMLTADDPRLSDDDRDEIERRLVDHAAGTSATPGQLRERARRLILALDPDGARRRRESAQRRRTVRLRADDDGMAWLTAYLPAKAAQACFETLDSYARTPNTAGVEARRADALVTRILTGHLDPSVSNNPTASDDRAPIQVVVNVTVPLSTLTRADDAPGSMAGHGPIDAELGRMLAFGDDSTWRRLVTDPLSDTVIDVGTTRYRPPQPLARLVRARDVTCRWPGCSTPAKRCDLDHTVPFPAGATRESNLVALCRRHHRLKTLARFDTTQRFGVWQVRTPSGRVVASTPPAQTEADLWRALPTIR